MGVGFSISNPGASPQLFSSCSIDVGKTIINHPPKSPFLFTWYKQFPKGWCMTLFYPHYDCEPNSTKGYIDIVIILKQIKTTRANKKQSRNQKLENRKHKTRKKQTKTKHQQNNKIKQKNNWGQSRFSFLFLFFFVLLILSAGLLFWWLCFWLCFCFICVG